MRKSDWLQLFAQPEEPAQAGENAGDTAPDAGERQEDFEDLIRGRYKADFDARVRKILDGRLRGLRQEVAQLRQWERERDLRHQAAMGRLSRQEPEIQRVYPEFRWQREMDDPGFARLIDAGVEPREAYEMVHRRELTAKAMHFAAQMAARQAARVVAAAGSASGKIPDAAPATAAGPGEAHQPGAGGHPQASHGRGEDQLLSPSRKWKHWMKKGECL